MPVFLLHVVLTGFSSQSYNIAYNISCIWKNWAESVSLAVQCWQELGPWDCDRIKVYWDEQGGSFPAPTSDRCLILDRRSVTEAEIQTWRSLSSRLLKPIRKVPVSLQVQKRGEVILSITSSIHLMVWTSTVSPGLQKEPLYNHYTDELSLPPQWKPMETVQVGRRSWCLSQVSGKYCRF